MHASSLILWLGASVAFFVAAFEWPFGSVPRYRSERWHTYIAAASGLFVACSALELQDLDVSVILLVHRAQIAGGAVVSYGWLRYARLVLPGERNRLETWLERAQPAIGALSLLGLLQAGTMHASTIGARYWLIDCNPVGQVSYLALLAGLGVSLRRFCRAVQARVPYAWPHALALGAVLATGLNDVAATLGAPTLPYLLTIGMFCEVVALGIIAARRWAADARRAAELSASLEVQVEARTRELLTVQSALERSERLAVLGRVAAGVAHEINNPAAAVGANLEFLRDSLESGTLDRAEAREALDDALLSVGRIARIVRELLATGRAAGQTSAGPVQVGPLLARAARRAELTPGIGSRASIGPRDCGELLAQGEAETLEQVLLNLAINGAQAIPAGRQGKVSLWAERRDDRVLIHVTDDGSGISESVKAHLFEPFFSTKAIGEGTGLGLSVSLGLVRGMGGDLLVATKEGSGTTMTVSLRAAERV